jgi:cell wall assembly regulator SMI1
VQKFTRPITREIEVGGERLALTFSETGLSVRPVGSRKPPREVTWPALLQAITGVSAEAGAGQAPEAGNPTGPAAPPSPHAAAPPAPPAPAERPPAPPATDAPSLLGRLAHWMGQHRRRFLEGLGPGATSEQLNALQTALGIPLPDDLRELLSWHNGQDDESAGFFREHWYLMSTHEIEAAWRELTAKPESGWRRAWIPFLEDDRGNYVSLDTDQPGGSVREYWEENPERPTVASSLAAWLQEFATAVERGEYVQDPERGVFVRQGEG